MATVPSIMARRNARSDPPPHRRWRRVLNPKSKSWPNIFKPKMLSFKSLGLDLRITPSLSLPRAPHIPPGRLKISGRPPADALFFVFLPFQNVFQNLLRKIIEKSAKIEDFGLPKPSQNLPKMPSKSKFQKTSIFSRFFATVFVYLLSWKPWKYQLSLRKKHNVQRFR